MQGNLCACCMLQCCMLLFSIRPRFSLHIKSTRKATRNNNRIGSKARRPHILKLKTAAFYVVLNIFILFYFMHIFSAITAKQLEFIFCVFVNFFHFPFSTCMGLYERESELEVTFVVAIRHSHILLRNYKNKIHALFFVVLLYQFHLICNYKPPL